MNQGWWVDEYVSCCDKIQSFIVTWYWSNTICGYYITATSHITIVTLLVLFCFVHFFENREMIIALMMEAARTSETSVGNYFTRQYIPEDKSELDTRRHDNLKSHIFQLKLRINGSSAT
jgi:hypothetical protein